MKGSTEHNRYLGFDFLRGICALFVCIYHLCLWHKIANFHLIGCYSVYVFFILSGASMTIAYADKFAAGMDFGTFLARRFFRLAPLYWLVALTFGYANHYWAPLMLNLTFLFGLANPAFSSHVVGGWSLGIEFLFYLLFPVFLLCIRGKWRPYIILAVSILLQQLFVNSWIQTDHDLTDHVYEYTQFAAFIAYFTGGCVIGKALINRPGQTVRPSLIWLLFLVVFLGMQLFAAFCQDHYIANITGTLFVLACIISVWLSGMLRFSKRLHFLPHFSGRISYGLYLLHPVLYFQLTAHTDLAEIMGATSFVALIVISSIILAFLSEKYFETPIKNKGYRWLESSPKPQ